MEETGMCMRWVDNMACEVIANTFREHVEQGLDDFEEISGKILAEYVKVRLEGGI